jgi:hypothetical protein
MRFHFLISWCFSLYRKLNKKSTPLRGLNYGDDDRGHLDRFFDRGWSNWSAFDRGEKTGEKPQNLILIWLNFKTKKWSLNVGWSTCQNLILIWFNFKTKKLSLSVGWSTCQNLILIWFNFKTKKLSLNVGWSTFNLIQLWTRSFKFSWSCALNNKVFFSGRKKNNKLFFFVFEANI